MIERTKYKNQLIDLLEKVEEGKNCHVLMLSGSEKSGKTQLLKNTFSPFEEHLMETTFFKEDTSRLAPVVQLIRQLIQQYGKDKLGKNSSFKFLSALLPELGALNQQPDVQTLVMAVSDTIKSYCTNSKLIWIIDNGHLIDTETSNFLIQLLPKLKKSPLLIIISCRKNNQAVLPINHLSDFLNHQPNFLDVTLQPFDLPEILKLGKEVFSQSVSREFGNSLLNFTSGNPFFICEIFKNLNESQIDQLEFNIEELVKSGKWKIPKTIVLAIGIRQKEENPDALKLLKVAAFYGFQFEMELLESVCEDFSSIDNLINHDWIIPLENDQGIAEFKNKLTLLAIRETISWSEKKRIAGKIADYLDEKQQEYKAEISGDFWKIAGEKENARKAYIKASSFYCHKKEYKEAVISAQKALSLWKANFDLDSKAEVLENMAECARNSGLLDEAISAYRELLTLPILENNLTQKAFITRSLAICFSQTGLWNDYKSLRIEAAELFQQANLFEEAAIEFHELSNRSFDEINAPEGIKFIKKAIDCAKTGNSLEKQIRSEAQYAYLMAIAGNGEEALPMIEKTLEKALENQFVEAIAYVYRKFAGILEYNSDFTNSIQTYNKVLDYCKTQNLPVQSQLCVSCMSWVFFRLGEWKKSIEACQTVIDDEETHAQSKALAFLILALIKIYRGELKSAENYLHKSEGLALTSGFELVSFMLLWPKALFREYNGETESAIKYYQSIQDIWYEKEDLHDILGGLFDALTFYFKIKSVENCNAIVVILTKILTKSPNKEVQACLSYGLGGIAFLAENFTEGENYFEQAWKMFTKLSMPLQESQAAYYLGKVLLEQNEKKKGYTKIQNAFTMAKNAGMRGIISNWDEVKDPVTLSEGQLTRRQMEILLALKDGLSNKEIAVKHHLSTRTVDMHVSNILDRLNCRNRTEAINIAQSMGIIE